MVNVTEAGQLLTITAAVTGRTPTAAQAQGWAWALDDLPYPVAEQALRTALAEGETYITPPTIRRHARAHLRRLAADVRSARIRGLVPRDWPETRPLPPDAAAALAAEWAATNDAGELHAAAPHREIEQ